jgi:ribosomal protein S18 acetylase RimI-like enzyme
MDDLTNTAVTYRDAKAVDVEDIVALVQSAYRGDVSRLGWTTEADLLDGQRTDAAAVTEIIGGDTSRMLLAVTDDDRILGCCHLDDRGNGVAYFGMFAVSPLLQGGGLGRGLLSEAERIAREELGARKMEMTVLVQRQDLIAWYVRRGYSPSGETKPFPRHDKRFGLPRRDDLEFGVLTKPLTDDASGGVSGAAGQDRRSG